MNEHPTETHAPVTDATAVDLRPVGSFQFDPSKPVHLATGGTPTGDDGPLADVGHPMTAQEKALRRSAKVAETDLLVPEGDWPMQRATHELEPDRDYSDVEATVLRSIQTAEMLASLRVSGEQVDPVATEQTVHRINDLRRALGGIGQVGQHFNAVGTPVGDQVAVILTAHDVNALIMRLTGKVRLETI